MMGSSAGTGTASRYLDPNHVFELVTRRRPRELLDYLDLIPGASQDLNYHRIKLIGRALLALVSQPGLPSPGEDMWILWAQLALFHAANSRFCAPQMVGNPSDTTSDAGHYTHPNNSSSYSGRMLTHEPAELRHTAVHNQLSVSNSRIHAATLFPLRASSTDGTHASAYVPSRGNSTPDHYMHPHSSSSCYRRMLNREPDKLIHSSASSSRTAATSLPLQEKFDDVHRHAAMHNQLSVSSSRIHSAMLPPLQANTMSNFPSRHTGMCDETSASNLGTDASANVPLRNNSMLAQEFAELSLGRPGSEQYTPQMLTRNTEAVRPTVDIEGKRPAYQIKAKILRLNVASAMTHLGCRSAVGILIRDGSTGQFMTASCLRTLLYMDRALLFAAACCEGVKSAVLLYEPTAIVLESHQFPLLEHLIDTRSGADEFVQLKQLLRSNPPYFKIQIIPKKSNSAACQLVCHAYQMEESKKVCKDPPDWLVPYLDQ